MKKLIVFVFSILFLLSACIKIDLNELINANLEGSWELTSKKVDGDEWIGNYYSAEFRFEKTGPTTGKWYEIYTDQFGLRESELTYVIKEDGNKITTPIPVTYDIEIEQNNLEIIGEFSGSIFEFSAIRK